MRDNSPRPETAALARDIEIITRSPEETMKLGEKLARYLESGAVIALRGALGAGKTCLAKGIARGLGVKETVTSPTYTIICEYEGALPFYHIDAYRLSGDGEFEALGAGELLSGEGVTVIEWSERVPLSIPPDAWTVELGLLGDGGRRIRVRAAGPVLDRGLGS
jgi:tRNA threonylcarbamoyladenosine biosynthesis protein TsaE